MRLSPWAWASPPAIDLFDAQPVLVFVGLDHGISRMTPPDVDFLRAARAVGDRPLRIRRFVDDRQKLCGDVRLPGSNSSGYP